MTSPTLGRSCAALASRSCLCTAVPEFPTSCLKPRPPAPRSSPPAGGRGRSDRGSYGRRHSRVRERCRAAARRRGERDRLIARAYSDLAAREPPVIAAKLALCSTKPSTTRLEPGPNMVASRRVSMSTLRKHLQPLAALAVVTVGLMLAAHRAGGGAGQLQRASRRRSYRSQQPSGQGVRPPARERPRSAGRHGIKRLTVRVRHHRDQQQAEWQRAITQTSPRPTTPPSPARPRQQPVPPRPPAAARRH